MYICKCMTLYAVCAFFVCFYCLQSVANVFLNDFYCFGINGPSLEKIKNNSSNLLQQTLSCLRPFSWLGSFCEQQFRCGAHRDIMFNWILRGLMGIFMVDNDIMNVKDVMCSRGKLACVVFKKYFNDVNTNDICDSINDVCPTLYCLCKDSIENDENSNNKIISRMAIVLTLIINNDVRRLGRLSFVQKSKILTYKLIDKWHNSIFVSCLAIIGVFEHIYFEAMSPFKKNKMNNICEIVKYFKMCCVDPETYNGFTDGCILIEKETAISFLSSIQISHPMKKCCMSLAHIIKKCKANDMLRVMLTNLGIGDDPMYGTTNTAEENNFGLGQIHMHVVSFIVYVFVFQAQIVLIVHNVNAGICIEFEYKS